MPVGRTNRHALIATLDLSAASTAIGPNRRAQERERAAARMRAAQLDVIDGHKIVAHQRQIVDELKREGRNPSYAERILQLFEQSLASLEGHLNALLDGREHWRGHAEEARTIAEQMNDP